MNLTQNLSDFIKSAPTAYHAVGAIAAKLKSEGATELDEKARWTLEPGKSYYVSRSGSSLIAFRMGRKNPAESGFMIQGAHTDSPALKARLEKLLSGRTSFVIAHRLSTIRNADMLLVLDKGQIVERGKHDELLEKKGFYYHLYMSQFRRDLPEEIAHLRFDGNGHKASESVKAVR